MEIFWQVFLLILFTVATIGLAVFLPVYWRATIASMAAENRELRKKYLSATRDIYNIRHSVQQSLLQWPIWPRPVLYSDIDTRIQHSFAQLTNVFSQSDSSDNFISDISQEWLLDARSGKFPFIEYYQLRQILYTYRENLKRINQLTAQAEELSKSIVNCQSEISKRV